MKKRIGILAGLTLLLQLVFAVSASASSTGSLTYNLQEGLHRTITHVTGISIPHGYIWIYVNGDPILAVDPPIAMF